MSAPNTTPADDGARPDDRRRWLVLVVLGVAQLMVVLDATIVNIALPSAQADLGFGEADRQWVVTAYALAFGSLLLIGGRLGDLFGRRRVFVTGLLGFALASAVGGFAGSFGVLVAARALQGAFGALLAPAALSLLSVTFAGSPERNKAFGVFGAIAGGGAAVGLLLGGVLTEYLSWRWCLFVNLAFAVPAALGALALVVDAERPERPHVDVPGTLAISAGLFCLVYGFSNAETNGWGDPVTVAMLVVALVLVAVFVRLQQRVAHPLLPLRIVADRNRGGAYLAMGVTGVVMFGIFLFLTFFMQDGLGFSPIQTGLAFLPMTGAIMTSATLGSTFLLGRFGPRRLVPTGMALATVALVWLAQLDPGSDYAGGILPALLVLGVGLGQVFAPSFATATLGVEERDSGVASAMVNVMQQVGGGVGTALLSTLAASAGRSYGADNAATFGSRAELQAAATIHGYTTAFWISAGILAVGAVVVALLLRPGRIDTTAVPEGAAAMA